ncbi:hypothetical protein [Ferrovum sp.]|uniref:hypothetical protein n=1 Tax=Ferrovum sp. TaxID=2609467 RepID=UPI00260C58BD|nr:hypothetical protein [Ferrovum sp.]
MKNTIKNKPFSTSIDTMNQNLFYFPVHIECRYTNVSMDPLLVEQLVTIFGSFTHARAWVSQIANQISTLRSTKRSQTRFSNAGLSRLVCREAWRMVIDPDEEHLLDIKAAGGSHPLRPVEPERKKKTRAPEKTLADDQLSTNNCME